ncbi:hypothetical protein COT50_03540 [candidate division WWE3 bacterium CG08_land_8_20_14_0_20_41_10]|uniref:Uncharacterized protein n=1 Tax=candidate division WWE3 bacterium CG08_land_8_20_14_0_20_41_10 TaxID=1975085 RepID=A0A2H0XBI2_UNCKA|nr:MAG: hypothetical protein COT50_03540 [candidate division WWE3 bacterium CG08_land_8_20_14_0_20_41_10]
MKLPLLAKTDIFSSRNRSQIQLGALPSFLILFNKDGPAAVLIVLEDCLGLIFIFPLKIIEKNGRKFLQLDTI